MMCNIPVSVMELLVIIALKKYPTPHKSFPIILCMLRDWMELLTWLTPMLSLCYIMLPHLYIYNICRLRECPLESCRILISTLGFMNLSIKQQFSLPCSGYSDEVDNSSDDDTGLQKSFSNIQRPPEVDPCSRQNSNGSQSSLESR